MRRGNGGIAGSLNDSVGVRVPVHEGSVYEIHCHVNRTDIAGLEQRTDRPLAERPTAKRSRQRHRHHFERPPRTQRQPGAAPSLNRSARASRSKLRSPPRRDSPRSRTSPRTCPQEIGRRCTSAIAEHPRHLYDPRALRLDPAHLEPRSTLVGIKAQQSTSLAVRGPTLVDQPADG